MQERKKRPDICDAPVKKIQISTNVNFTWNEKLLITENTSLAEQMAAEGFPVLGILTEANRADTFKGVKYLCEGTESLTEEYLEKVYRRYKGLPCDILETERCLVRETAKEDVDAFFRIYAEPAVKVYMDDLFSDREEQIEYILQYRKSMYEFCDFGIWTVILKETGEIIGRAGFALREGYEEPELGFVIGVPWQKHGLATEVCEAILKYGVEELEFTRVQALAAPDNTTSHKLLQKLGFVCMGECEEKGKKYLQFLKKE